MPPDTKTDDKKTKKYLDKFETDDELAKAYAELEKKLGTQGGELGTAQKQLQEAVKALQEYAKALQQMKPVYDWYVTNEDEVKRRFSDTDASRIAKEAAKSTLGYELLTSDEKKALFEEWKGRLAGEVLQPFAKNLLAEVQKYGTGEKDAVANQLRAFTDVMWRTMQFVLPEDKVKAAREWHEEAMKFADPSKVDPLHTAQEMLKMRSTVADLTAKIDTLTKEKETLAKQGIPSVSGGQPSPSWAAKPDDEEKPLSRDERMQKVMDSTRETVGADAFQNYWSGPGGT